METKLPPISSEVSDRGFLVTLLLCIFGGISGIHRLYTGHVVLAALYFLTGGFLLVGVILDIFRLLFGDFTDVSGRRLR